MTGYLLIAVGGGLGAMARYWLGLAIFERVGGSMPWGTLAVNALGCFLIGLLGTLALETSVFSGHARRFLLPGLLGGFTTFSAFSFEVHERVRDGESLTGVAYIVLTLALCLGGVFLGGAVARLVD